MRQHARPLCRHLLGAGRRDHALAEAIRPRLNSPQVGSVSTEDRAASEAAHCWGVRMSFNIFSHKKSGLRSPVLASAMSFVAIARLTPSSLQCVVSSPAPSCRRLRAGTLMVAPLKALTLGEA
jgi:hypothetical protein